jgi:hypothetical protein
MVNIINMDSISIHLKAIKVSFKMVWNMGKANTKINISGILEISKTTYMMGKDNWWKKNKHTLAILSKVLSMGLEECKEILLVMKENGN